MAESFACTDCDKTFNMRIKLNKHLKTHTGQSGPKDFLDPRQAWTDEDKVMFYDELSDKFSLVRDKIKECSQRCNLLEAKLKGKKPKPKTKPKRKNRFVRHRAGVGNDEDLVDDQTIPAGWRSAVRRLSARFGEGLSAVVYWAPDGRHCSSRREALHYMASVLEAPAADTARMRAGLLADGWKAAEHLPEGWLAKQHGKERGHKFITADYTLCRNPKQAVRFMMKHLSKEEISVFVCHQFLRGEVPATAVRWVEGEGVPEGWRLATTSTRLGVRGQLILAPTGLVLASTKTFRDLLEKEEGLEAVEVDAMVEVLGRETHRLELEAEPGWRREPSLPEGWMKLGEESYFLSPQGAVIRSRKAVMELIHGKAAVTRSMEEVPRKSMRVWEEDERLPEGWQVWRGKEVNNFRGPAGQEFKGRHEAIRFMEEMEAGEEEVAMMKAGMEEDGWKREEHLPTGWRVRQVRRRRLKDGAGKEERTELKTEYLTATMDLLASLREVVAHMRGNSYSEEAIQKLKSVKWEQDPELPQGWMFKMSRSLTKVFINSEGKYFSCLNAVLREMWRVQSSSEEMEQGREAMRRQGWQESEFLPAGWMFKSVSYHSGLLYLTEEFKMLRRKIEALEQLAGLGKEAVDMFTANYDALINRVAREPAEAKGEKKQSSAFASGWAALTWQEDASLPAGWKVSPYTVARGKYLGASRPRFLHTASCRMFVTRELALAAMVEDPAFGEEEVAVMRRSFLQAGWQQRDFLPRSWLMKESTSTSRSEKGKLTYLAPTGVKMVTRERVLAYMKEHGCSEDELDRFKEGCSDIKYLSDAHLPAGWKRGQANVGHGRTVPRWLCPQGKLYNSRATAIHSLLTPATTQQEVELWRAGFPTEGFSEDNLPAGWMRKWGKGSHTWMWVSPTFQVIKNQKELVRHLEVALGMDRESTELEELVEQLMKDPPVQKAKSKFNKVKGNFDFKWEEDESLPEGWKSSLFTPALAEMAGCR